jgi:hypothetical protein
MMYPLLREMGAITAPSSLPVVVVVAVAFRVLGFRKHSYY